VVSKFTKHLKKHKTKYAVASGVALGGAVGAVAISLFWKWEGRNRFLAMIPNEPGKYIIAGCKMIDGGPWHFVSEAFDMAESVATEFGTQVL
jgi:hypothetical protein